MEQNTQTHLSEHIKLHLQDTVLPAHISPSPSKKESCKAVLLTGATGFLGGYLLATILAETDWDIYCIVRAKNKAEAKSRVLESIKKTDRTGLDWESRIHAVCGDTGKTRFGLSEKDYLTLAKTVQAVLHNAAQVNWIKSYKALRGTNVIGTLHAIEFACEGNAKPLYFVSTLAACFAQDGPKHVDESTDMTSYFEGIPLGYAQTKCISEALLRQASARGLPVTIIRPSLLCGDAKTGRTNDDDLISRLIKGCVSLGKMLDINWMLDCIPVDSTAKIIITSMKQPVYGLRVIHAHHPKTRAWQEMALWLNLSGYPVKLVPLEEWLNNVESMPRGLCPEFYLLRSFFLARPTILQGKCQLELYLEHNRRNINSNISNRWIEENGLTPPPLNAPLISRYFNSYVNTGYLPAVTNQQKGQYKNELDYNFIEHSLRKFHADKDISIIDFITEPIGNNSIINELCAAHTGANIGLWRVHGKYLNVSKNTEHPFDMVVKVKTDDVVPRQIAKAVAALRDGALTNYAPELIRALGITSAHHRELSLYDSANLTLSQHMPKIFATKASTESGTYMVAMEYLKDVEMLDSVANGKTWTHTHIQSAIQGLALIHSACYGKEETLHKQPFLLPPLETNEIKRMMPFWKALAESVAPVFSYNLGITETRLHQHYLRTMPEWCSTLQSMPQTLIHNDFNPRNLAFKRSGKSLELCAYDWELACIGVPQHDLAELLCFTLPQDATPGDIFAYIEAHRLRLQKLSGKDIDSTNWLLGFKLSLRYLLISRLALYALYHQISPQSFLPNVLTNWQRLYQALNIPRERVNDDKSTLLLEITQTT